MSPEDTRSDTAASPDEAVASSRPPRYDWDDPSVPPGDAPAMPRWPMILGAVAWGGWVIFLVVMAIVRIRTTPI